MTEFTPKVCKVQGGYVDLTWGVENAQSFAGEAPKNAEVVECTENELLPQANAKPKKSPKPKVVVTSNYSKPVVKAEKGWFANFVEGATDALGGVFGLACSANKGLTCNDEVNVINDKIGRAINTKVNMKLNSNTAHFSAQISVPAEGESVGYLQELENGQGAIWVAYGFRNSFVGADESGMGHINSIEEGEYEACVEDQSIENCTPYQGVGGLVPIGRPKVDEGGFTMLHNLSEGSYEYCSYAPMLDRIFTEPVFQYEGDLVVRHRSIDYEIDPDGVEIDKFYSVSPDGFLYCGDDYCPTDVSDPVAYAEQNANKASGLTDGQSVINDLPVQTYIDQNRGFSYFKVDAEGAYQDKDADGNPIPIDASENPAEKDYELLLNPDITLKDIIEGNPDVGEAGVGLAGIKEAVIPIDLSLLIEDNREGRDSTLPQSIGPLAGEDISTLPISKVSSYFSDNGEFKLGLNPSGNGIVENHMPAYVYGANFMTKAFVTCDQEEPVLDLSSEFADYGEHEDPDPFDIDGGTEDDGGVDVIEDAGIDTESDIPTDTGAGDVDADTDVDADADTDVDTDTGTGDIEVDSGLPEEEPDTDEMEEDGGPSSGGTF